VRRLCDVRVINISQSLPLFELSSAQSPNRVTLRDNYEAALLANQQKEFRK